LSQSHSIAAELSSCVLVVIDAHMELLVRVDSIDTAWLEVTFDTVAEDVDRALSVSITVAIDSIGVRGVASVTSCAEGIFVRLHNVELWAPVTVNLIGITVAKYVVNMINGWHQDGVKSCHTATANLAEVHIVLETTSEHVWGEECTFVNLLLSSEVHAIVVIEIESAIEVCGSFGPFSWPLYVESRIDAIDVSNEWLVAVVWHGLALANLTAARGLRRLPLKWVSLGPREGTLDAVVITALLVDERGAVIPEVQIVSVILSWTEIIGLTTTLCIVRIPLERIVCGPRPQAAIAPSNLAAVIVLIGEAIATPLVIILVWIRGAIIIIAS